mmetsp:Transcript_10294/g.31833  ORF Transcript_10294/g.31833 Transcript_10294/m.31833 type:complete len:238 (-) Transcript_10294:233-946(-)
MCARNASSVSYRFVLSPQTRHMRPFILRDRYCRRPRGSLQRSSSGMVKSCAMSMCFRFLRIVLFCTPQKRQRVSVTSASRSSALTLTGPTSSAAEAFGALRAFLPCAAASAAASSASTSVSVRSVSAASLAFARARRWARWRRCSPSAAEPSDVDESIDPATESRSMMRCSFFMRCSVLFTCDCSVCTLWNFLLHSLQLKMGFWSSSFIVRRRNSAAVIFASPSTRARTLATWKSVV